MKKTEKQTILKQLAAELSGTWRINGIKEGYPTCCIDSFCSGNLPTKAQNKVINGNGFVPCNECAIKIINGNVTIYDLIKNPT